MKTWSKRKNVWDQDRLVQLAFYFHYDSMATKKTIYNVTSTSFTSVDMVLCSIVHAVISLGLNEILQDDGQLVDTRQLWSILRQSIHKL